MHGPKKRAGGVGALEGVRTPSLVAQTVMDETDHHLLVGKGAQEFARSVGFKIEDDLNTERSRAAWLEWKRRDRSAALPRSDQARRRRCGASSCEMMARGARSIRTTSTARSTATASTPKGEICGVTTTSGLAWKIPGPGRRLADSRRRALRRRRGRRRRIDRPRRGESLQPLLVPDRRGDAPRRAPEGRRDGGAQADQGEHDREAAAQQPRRAELRHQLLRADEQG